MAGAGLNWIRLPIPFWAIETWEGEPFLAKVCWKWVLGVVLQTMTLCIISILEEVALIFPLQIHPPGLCLGA